jgi:predicted DCC family thiol-disulfide oxidoreductase YuxK
VPRLRTTPPPRLVILYDGHCRFCSAQMRRLARLLPDGAYEAASFQDEGVLERFPGLTWEQAMRAIQVVDTTGRVFTGLEGIVRALAALRLLGRLAYIYYIPGIRQLGDAVYAAVARRRYRIAGRTCDAGTCALHDEL